MQGNQCHKFIKRLDKLEMAFHLVGTEVAFRGQPFVQCLKDFEQVVHLSFGRHLLPGYETAIARFSVSYRDLDISVTPKVGEKLCKLIGA